MKKFSTKDLKAYLETCSSLQEALEKLSEESIVDVNQRSRYTESMKWDGEIMTSKDFHDWVFKSQITNQQVTAYPAIYIDSYIAVDLNHELYFHDHYVEGIPGDATHIVWYGKK